MQSVGQLLGYAAGLGGLICFIMVLIKMFQNGQTVLGIACIVLLFCCIGGFVAYIAGWVKHREWGITTVMIVWTGCFILGLIANVVAPPDFELFQQQLQQQPRLP